MDTFSNKLFGSIIKEFPEWKDKVDTNAKYLELVIKKKDSKIGGLIIQTTSNQEIWIRNYHPCSGYFVDDFKELIMLIKGIFADQILWLIEYKGEDWNGTTFINNTEKLEIEEGITYHILSWSGTKDKISLTS